MDLKQLRVGVVGIAIGASFMLCLMVFFPRSRGEDIARIATLEAQVSEQRNTITAYQRALIGEERDLVSMYDSVQSAGQIDIVVHSDTESGLPVKFVLDCGGSKQ